MERRWNMAELLARHGIDVRQLAELSGVNEVHVEAMVKDRWTPSPEQRDAIARVFGLTRDDITWWHAASVFEH